MDREEPTELRAALETVLTRPPVELMAEEKSEPTATHAPWVKSISSYERKETTVVEGLRYG
jgi:hypothetical protein